MGVESVKFAVFLLSLFSFFFFETGVNGKFGIRCVHQEGSAQRSYMLALIWPPGGVASLSS